MAAPRVLLAVAAAAAAVVTVTVVPEGDRRDAHAGYRPVAATEALREAAAAARRAAPAPDLRRGGLWHVALRRRELRVAGGQGTGYRHIVSMAIDHWFDARDAGGLRIRQVGEWHLPTPSDRAGWEAAGAPGRGDAGRIITDARGPGMAHFRVGRRVLGYRGLRALPRAPHRLLAALQGPGRRDDAVLRDAAVVLAEAPLPRSLRAGLLEALAGLPTLRATRAGHLVRLAAPGRRTTTTVTLDVGRAAVLELREVADRAGAPRLRAGDEVLRIRYSARRLVTRMPAAQAR